MRKKIGELLVESGAVTEEEVRTALGQQRTWGASTRLGDILVATQKVSHKQVAKALAAQFGVPYVELPELPRELEGLAPAELLSAHRMVPFRLDSEGKTERVHVAVEDPSRLDAIDELRFKLRRSIRVYVAPSNEIDAALARLRGDGPLEVGGLELPEAGEELQVERNPTAFLMNQWQGESTEAEQPATPPPPPREPLTVPELAAKEASSILDELLGGLSPEAPASKPAPAPPPPPPPKSAPVKVYYFEKKPRPPPSIPPVEIEELEVLDDPEPVEPTATEAPPPTTKASPVQLAANLILLLVRKGVFSERELLDELSQVDLVREPDV